MPSRLTYEQCVYTTVKVIVPRIGIIIRYELPDSIEKLKAKATRGAGKAWVKEKWPRKS